ncbi:phospholipid-transporting ATPase 2 isoform X1 [Tanacetum coccineum]
MGDTTCGASSSNLVTPSKRKVGCSICKRNMHHEKAFCGHIRWHMREERDANIAEIAETLALRRHAEEVVLIAKKIKISDLNEVLQPDDTAALDGETDLKTRSIPSACMGIDSELLHKIKGKIFAHFIGVIECPSPDKDVRRFDANLRLFPPFLDNDVCPLTIKKYNPPIVLFAKYRLGLWCCCIYSSLYFYYRSNETKLGMSRGVAEPKLTAMDAMIDKLTGAIFIFQIVVVIVLGIAGNIWKDTEARKVSLDLVKSLYAKFIDWDKQMVDVETGTSANATNTAINVELLNAINTGSPDATRFLTVMAICNTVIPIKSSSGIVSYKAQSQDEEALVRAAASMHMAFVNKNSNILDINFNGTLIQYEVLDYLEFTSDRKRMSVVVRDCVSRKIFLLSKGADETILPCAQAGHQTKTFSEAVDQYAQMGLRTLCLAWREINEIEYQDWSVMFKEANSTLVDREWRVVEVCERLEHDLEILGVAAIEDRLQDGVPETIETLRKAGINFWMLTGDKQNTAIQIALSCNFVSPEPKGQLLLINGKTQDEVCRNLERVLLTMRITKAEPKDVAFVIDGWALEIALKYYRKAFT